MNCLQVVATRSIRKGYSKAVSSAVRHSKASRIGNYRSAPLAQVGGLYAQSIRPLNRPFVARYSTQTPTDQEQLWEDVDGVEDFYDPRFDSDYPEEEGTSCLSYAR